MTVCDMSFREAHRPATDNTGFCIGFKTGNKEHSFFCQLVVLHAAGLDKLREVLQSDVGTSTDDCQDYDAGDD